MSFPRYPAYKPSGVEWLGQVPEHWASRRLGFFFAERREKVSDKDFQALSVTKDGIVPQLDTAAKTDDGDNRKCVRTGDFVINSRSDRKGSSGLSRLDGSVSLICTVLRPQESIQGGFIHHLLRSVSFQEEFYRFGKGIVADLWSTNYSAMSGITLAMPPLEEQESIASFLDRETAKIDALIAEQQRLIELLQEKRQAVISHAVTKGLNPDAPMKDSGVEWLGEVPVHWQILELKHLKKEGTSITYGIVQAGPNIEDGIPYIRTSDMAGDQLKLATCQRTSLEIDESYARSRVAEGDLVVAIRATVGKVLEVPVELDGANLTQGTAKFSPGPKVCAKFLKSSFEANYCQSQIMSYAKGATFLEITLDVLRRLELAIPPLSEQQEIVQYLTGATAQLGDLLVAAEQMISLLQERRSALISAAVTGQIDVRGLVPETEAA